LTFGGVRIAMGDSRLRLVVKDGSFLVNALGIDRKAKVSAGIRE
jgi:hypothetical protein